MYLVVCVEVNSADVMCDIKPSLERATYCGGAVGTISR